MSSITNNSTVKAFYYGGDLLISVNPLTPPIDKRQESRGKKVEYYTHTELIEIAGVLGIDVSNAVTKMDVINQIGLKTARDMFTKST